ncbi:hypothetical protein VIGAN_11130600 [Vigna angularis var. angularis]|uniref:Uncharacterized protein n=1 Tax=Vigna angularis var. angularis TaxID=157739 RepID=A0A0S3TAJ3_PHAAN|nr:hypothetical protein VIGAN_11130600 [Vigna angularis var. angularis]
MTLKLLDATPRACWTRQPSVGRVCFSLCHHMLPAVTHISSAGPLLIHYVCTSPNESNPLLPLLIPVKPAVCVLAGPWIQVFLCVIT